MVAETSEQYLRVFCPVHKIKFDVPGTGRIVCESGGHELSNNFPYEEVWEYCCDCQCFWPSTIGKQSKAREQCLVCERVTDRRYLCGWCKLLSIESNVAARRKAFYLVSDGRPQPSCPACFSRPTSATQHQCAEFAASFSTDRLNCPFCDEAVTPAKTLEEKPAALDRMVNSDRQTLPDGKREVRSSTLSSRSCPACRMTNKTEDKFCKSCGHRFDSDKRPSPSPVKSPRKPLEKSVQQTSAPSSLPERERKLTVPPKRSTIAPAVQTPSLPSVPSPAGNGTKAQATAPPISPAALPLSKEQPSSHRSIRVPIAIGALLAVLILTYASVVIWQLWSSPETKIATETEKDTGKKNTQPVAPPGMAYVPGGEFMMGGGDDPLEIPSHKVVVKPFFIDLYEVTCEEYAKFVRAKKHAAPASWNKGQFPSGMARRPVTGVDWDDARAYAQWAGKRLPTEEEWEFAARGTDGRRYPWGNEWKDNLANADASQEAMTDIGAYTGVSPFGAFDMVGNAWEWTATDLAPYPNGRFPARLPGNIELIRGKVIRGGSFETSKREATTTFRRGWPASGENYDYTSFRCVKDVK